MLTYPAVSSTNAGEQASTSEKSSAANTNTEESEEAESEKPDIAGRKESENTLNLDRIKYLARIADNHACRIAVNKVKADPTYIAADDATKRTMEEQSRNEVMTYRKRKGIDYQSKIDRAALGQDPKSVRLTQQAINEAMLNYAAPIPETTAADVDAWYQQLAASSRYGHGVVTPKAAAERPRPKMKRNRISELQAFRAYEANVESGFLTDTETADESEVELQD